jgi:hypothetical protein
MRYRTIVSCCFLLAMSASAFGQQPSIGMSDDSIKVLVGRLYLERYKTTINGLTQFGDRRQGTNRNRQAIDWIEATLKAFGCTTTERLRYEYQPQAEVQQRRATPARAPVIASGEVRAGQGGARLRGVTRVTGVNEDPQAQPDARLRALNSQPSTPGPRELVYCTKIGKTRPNEMYALTWTDTAGARLQTTTVRGLPS